MTYQEELQARITQELLLHLYVRQVMQGRWGAEFRAAKAHIARSLNRPITDVPNGRRSGTRKFDWGFEVMFMQVIEQLATDDLIEVRQMESANTIITRNRRIRDFKLTDRGIDFTRKSYDVSTLSADSVGDDPGSISSDAVDLDPAIAEAAKAAATVKLPAKPEPSAADVAKSSEDTDEVNATIAETRIMTKSEIGNLSETVKRMMAEDADDDDTASRRKDNDESDRRQTVEAEKK